MQKDYISGIEDYIDGILMLDGPSGDGDLSTTMDIVQMNVLSPSVTTPSHISWSEFRSELSPMKMSALRRRANDVGVAISDLQKAVDADAPKEAVIDLIIKTKEEQAARAAIPTNDPAAYEKALREELTKLKTSELEDRAKDMEISEVHLEQAYDADDVKAALISLIMNASAENKVVAETKLRADLSSMKMSALRRRANDVGVAISDLQKAVDADAPKEA
eukprot:SAG11_NODE_4781_length_1767_cov_21.169065_3_plen_219_part_01